jgi:hypothetical protein
MEIEVDLPPAPFVGMTVFSKASFFELDTIWWYEEEQEFSGKAKPRFRCLPEQRDDLIRRGLLLIDAFPLNPKFGFLLLFARRSPVR